MVDRSTRARSFGAIAEDYDRFRPRPPLEAARWVLGDERERAVDLGAGTGALSRSLRELCSQVIAVEPDARMRAVLVAQLPEVRAVGGIGEAVPLRSDSVDAVLASSSWHWMDAQVATSEVVRILHPGGVFGLLWNSPDRSVPWVSELFGRRRRPAGNQVDHRQPTRALTMQLPLGVPETTVVRWSMSLDAEQLAGLAGTFSGVITRAGSGRQDRIDTVRRMAESLGSSDGSVSLPLACRCWRAVRLDH
jgi:SAM-dependent methyltransferase